VCNADREEQIEISRGSDSLLSELNVIINVLQNLHHSNIYFIRCRLVYKLVGSSEGEELTC